MKLKTFSLALFASSMLLTGCGTTGMGNLVSNAAQNANANHKADTDKNVAENGNSLFGNLLNGFLGHNATLSQKDLVGTWNFTGTDCVFESENLLAKAGGAVAASKVEDKLNEQLAKIGIKGDACTFTFNQDHTFLAKVSGRSIHGKYQLNEAEKTVKITYLGGLASMTPRVAKKNGKISLLLESSKLLGVAKGLSALSNSNTLKMVNSILGQYEGLYIGMQFKK